VLIAIDVDKFEHVLNCMANLSFVPESGRQEDEPIIRKAYLEAREMLHAKPVVSSNKALEIAARIWCDQDMKTVVMDVNAAIQIAKIIELVLNENKKQT
jgi:hypothetical protein